MGAVIHRSGRILAGFITGVLLVIAAGCGRPADKTVGAKESDACIIIEASGDTTGWNTWLAEHMPAAQRFPAAQISSAAETSLKSDRVLVVTAACRARDEIRSALADYVARGGRLLSLGLDAGLSTEPAAADSRIPPLYSETTDVFRIVASGVDIKTAPTPFMSPFRPITGVDGLVRWIPVIEAVADSKRRQGWAVSVFIRQQASERYSIYGWIGFEPGKLERESLIPVVAAAIEAMTRAVYIAPASVIPMFSAKAQKPLTATASWVDRRQHDLSPFRLAVSWVNERGIDIRRVISPPLDPLTMPVDLNIGLAPDTGQRSEVYTLRIALRDRNDQVSYDEVEHELKVFPSAPAPVAESIGITSGQLTIGRRPIFMMGVNYWPSLSARIAAAGRHWLSAADFDPRQVQSDLDLMVAVGINSIALEYTDIDQAPQLLFVLDELRSRSMWACLYVPALHPLDLRIDDAKQMLSAIRLETWPEVYAVEIARGLPVRKKTEMRRLDPAWSAWIDEHFNSRREAEQRLGIALWQERGRTAGPNDADLRKGPHRNAAVGLYYAFLHDYASRRIGYVCRWMKKNGYQTLITARSSYGFPDQPEEGVIDFLDISVGSLHLDFLFPDAWTIHPLRSMYHDGDLMHAYLRGLGDGKPIVWSAYGQRVGTLPSNASLQRQMEVYNHFLDLFIRQRSSGAYAWWFAPGSTVDGQEDWGIVNPQGTWRMVEDSFRSARLRLRQTKLQPSNPIRQNAPLNVSAMQWRDQMTDRSGFFAKAVSADVTEWMPPGTGLLSDALLDPTTAQRWTETDGFHLLNAEWLGVSVDGDAFDRAPTENVRLYAGKSLQLDILNSGSIEWLSAKEQKRGSIWLRISQPGHTDEWTALSGLHRGEIQSISWMPREPGIWELQPYMFGYGTFGERLSVEVTTPPRLF